MTRPPVYCGEYLKVDRLWRVLPDWHLRSWGHPFPSGSNARPTVGRRCSPSLPTLTSSRCRIPNRITRCFLASTKTGFPIDGCADGVMVAAAT